MSAELRDLQAAAACINSGWWSRDQLPVSTWSLSLTGAAHRQVQTRRGVSRLAPPSARVTATAYTALLPAAAPALEALSKRHTGGDFMALLPGFSKHQWVGQSDSFLNKCLPQTASPTPWVSDKKNHCTYSIYLHRPTKCHVKFRFFVLKHATASICVRTSSENQELKCSILTRSCSLETLDTLQCTHFQFSTCQM